MLEATTRKEILLYITEIQIRSTTKCIQDFACRVTPIKKHSCTSVSSHAVELKCFRDIGSLPSQSLTGKYVE